ADPVVVAAGSLLAAELEGAGFRSAGKARGLVRLSAPASPLPRAQLVPHAEAAPATVAIAAARAGRALDDPRLLIEADAVPGRAEGDPAGRVEVLELLPGAARFRLSVARPTWLVVREPYYANWRAAVDGRPVGISPPARCWLGV